MTSIASSLLIQSQLITSGAKAPIGGVLFRRAKHPRSCQLSVFSCQFPAVSSSFSLPSSVLLSQNQRAVFGDGDAVLKVSAVAAVLGDRGPLVVQQLCARLANVHHGLDGQHHAFA